MMDDDATEHKQTVLEIVLHGLHIPREVHELRFQLFLKAADFHFSIPQICWGNMEVLEPFPNCFYDPETKTRCYTELGECVKIISTLSLRALTDTTLLPEKAWALLHWIFTNPLKIEVVKESEISGYLSDVLREKTKLFSIPNPSVTCTRFDITHTDDIPKKIFLAHKAEFGSFFAYHGSLGRNFHSIIHRGLRCSLNVRSSYGRGTYLTSSLKVASKYSLKYQAGHVNYCVAIVEVIKHPSVTVVDRDHTSERSTSLTEFSSTSPTESASASPTESTSTSPTEPASTSIESSSKQYYVVDSDEFMRLRHLLVFN